MMSANTPKLIPLSQYRETQRRAGLRALGCIMLTFCVGIPLAGLAALPLAVWMRDTIGGDLGMGLGIGVLALAVAVPGTLMLLFMHKSDRAMGLACPQCGKSLTMGCHPEKVIATRRCSHCKATVLSDDGPENPVAKKSSMMTWALVGLGVAGLAVALWMHVAGRAQPVTFAGLAQLALLGAPFLALGVAQRLLELYLIRRWRRQSADDQVGHAHQSP